MHGVAGRSCVGRGSSCAERRIACRGCCSQEDAQGRRAALCRHTAKGVGTPHAADQQQRQQQAWAACVTKPRLLLQILGGDVAGVVEEADSSSRFKPGDKVFGCTGQQIFWSTYGAQF